MNVNSGDVVSFYYEGTDKKNTLRVMVVDKIEKYEKLYPSCGLSDMISGIVYEDGVNVRYKKFKYDFVNSLTKLDVFPNSIKTFSEILDACHMNANANIEHGKLCEVYRVLTGNKVEYRKSLKLFIINYPPAFLLNQESVVLYNRHGDKLHLYYLNSQPVFRVLKKDGEDRVNDMKCADVKSFSDTIKEFYS